MAECVDPTPVRGTVTEERLTPEKLRWGGKRVHRFDNGRTETYYALEVLHRESGGWWDQILVKRSEETAHELLALLSSDGERARLVEAVRGMSKDMHHPSMRGCPTCREITQALGEPFGCYAYQAQRIAREALSPTRGQDEET